MWCLWNGEYGEHDIAGMYLSKSSSEKNIQRMEEEYKKWSGVIVGDFTCDKVEYDWGRRDQRWTCHCNLCGRTIYQYHAQDWRRGKGRKTTCDCRVERKRKAEEEAKKAENERLEKIAQKQKDHLGKTYGDWKIIEYGGLKKCKVKCAICGKERVSSVSIDDVVNMVLLPCNHKIPTDYSGDEWIGKRNGNLTAIGRDGTLFICKCDCGRETRVRPVDLFTRKTKKNCGNPNCEYSTEAERASRKRHEKGHKYEEQTEEMLKSLGYNAKRTKCYSDFGVDIIITEADGTKVAVQCKKLDAPASITAIQEVYAGGRFYDCTKFSIICDKGFSNPAIIMARKLGVYLCEGEYAPPDDVGEYAANLLPVHQRSRGNEKLYDIDGERHTVADWCEIYGKSLHSVTAKMRRGVSFETAFFSASDVNEQQNYTVNGFTGSLTAICRHYGIPQPTVHYRMSKCGMTLEDAIFTKLKVGRPRKGNGLPTNGTHS